MNKQKIHDLKKLQRACEWMEFSNLDVESNGSILKQRWINLILYFVSQTDTKAQVKAVNKVLSRFPKIKQLIDDLKNCNMKP